jgi:uncharacterized protein YutE (UPF0331/DUF86 family)
VKVPDHVETSIVDKATYVEDAVAVLAAKRSLDEAVYRGEREQQAIVEREFQTAIEACIDIAGLLIRVSDGEMPETYGDRFDLLEELDVLTAETSEGMREAAGFRNVLVPQYPLAAPDRGHPMLGPGNIQRVPDTKNRPTAGASGRDIRYIAGDQGFRSVAYQTGLPLGMGSFSR